MELLFARFLKGTDKAFQRGSNLLSRQFFSDLEASSLPALVFSLDLHVFNEQKSFENHPPSPPKPKKKQRKRLSTTPHWLLLLGVGFFFPHRASFAKPQSSGSGRCCGANGWLCGRWRLDSSSVPCAKPPALVESLLGVFGRLGVWLVEYCFVLFGCCLAAC